MPDADCVNGPWLTRDATAAHRSCVSDMLGVEGCAGELGHGAKGQNRGHLQRRKPFVLSIHNNAFVDVDSAPHNFAKCLDPA